MAETFPDTGFELIDIELQHSIFSSKTRGGLTSEVRVADPFWAGELVTVALEREDLAIWETFLSECIDRQLTIDFVHPLYAVPRSYATEASYPGSATADVDAFPDGRTITVNGLSVGLVLKKGDRFSVEEGNRVLVYRVAKDVTVSSDTAQDIVFSPRMRTGLFTTAAVARFLNHKMRLRVRPNTVRAPLQGGKAPSVAFEVYEDGR